MRKTWRVNAGFESVRESHKRLTINTFTNARAQDRSSKNNKSHKLSTPPKFRRKLISPLKTLKMAMCF